MMKEINVDGDSSDESSAESYHSGSSSSGSSYDYTEEELLSLEIPITPNMVKTLKRSTSGYLCDPTVDLFDIEFISFQMKNPTVDEVVFFTDEPDNEEKPHAGCFREYTLKSSILELPYLVAELQFFVGAEPINELRLVENLFLGDVHLKTYDFTFGYWEANTSHLCRYNYIIPPLSDEMKQLMIDEPQTTTADSFFFVNNKLIMHCKATFIFEED